MTARRSNRYFGPALIATLLLLGAGWAMVLAGRVPILGLLATGLGPDVFLAGCVAASFCVASILASNKVVRAVLTIGLSILLGMNTRLPALFDDIWKGPAERTTVTSRLGGEIGQPLHVEADVPVLSARQDPFDHLHVGCLAGGCLSGSGFQAPFTWLESDYWHEKVLEAVLAAGFSEAHPGEISPTLTVRQARDGYRSVVQITLVDAKGTVVARYEGRYRNGWPLETPDTDDDKARRVNRPGEYLLHGNLFNSLAASVVPHPAPYPVAAFLRMGTALAHGQGTTFDQASAGHREPGNGSPSVNVTLEALAQKTYDPDWIIEDDGASPSKWSALAWDPSRGHRCDTMLTPEDPAKPVWYLFVNDATHRKKALNAGTPFCDPDAIWFEDYGSERGRAVLTRFSAQGDFVYRISFEKPPESRGFAGAIMIPTFRAENGYLYFDWWLTRQSGKDRHVAKSMQVRIKEPPSPPAANGAASGSGQQ